MITKPLANPPAASGLFTAAHGRCAVEPKQLRSSWSPGPCACQGPSQGHAFSTIPAAMLLFFSLKVFPKCYDISGTIKSITTPRKAAT